MTRTKPTTYAAGCRARAAVAIEAWRAAATPGIPGGPPDLATPEGRRYALLALVSDLRHLALDQGVSWAEVLHDADNLFRTERAEYPEPEATN